MKLKWKAIMHKPRPMVKFKSNSLFVFLKEKKNHPRENDLKAYLL